MFLISRFQIIQRKFNKFWISVGSVAAMTLLFFTLAHCGVAGKEKTGCRGHSLPSPAGGKWRTAYYLNVRRGNGVAEVSGIFFSISF